MIRFWAETNTAIPSEYAVLFHDANRALRARWLELLSGGAIDVEYGSGARAEALGKALVQGAALDEGARRDAQVRAQRRILPDANTVAQVAGALEEHLTGSVIDNHRKFTRKRWIVCPAIRNQRRHHLT